MTFYVSHSTLQHPVCLQKASENAGQIRPKTGNRFKGGADKLFIGHPIDFLPGVSIGHIGKPAGKVGEPVDDDV